MYNKIILIGNVVNDPECKSIQKTSVSKFRLAVNDPLRPKNTLYIDCEAWSEQSEFAQKWLKKGKPIIIDGRLCLDTWEKEGKKESKYFVKVSEIKFQSGPQNSEKSENEKSEFKKENKFQSKSKQQIKEKNENEEDEYSEVPF